MGSSTDSVFHVVAPSLVFATEAAGNVAPHMLLGNAKPKRRGVADGDVWMPFGIKTALQQGKQVSDLSELAENARPHPCNTCVLTSNVRIYGTEDAKTLTPDHAQPCDVAYEHLQHHS